MRKILSYKYPAINAICAILFCIILLCACTNSKIQSENNDFASVIKSTLATNPESIKMSVKKHIINPGDSMCVDLPKGKNVVYNLSADLRGDSQDITIKATFDDIELINVPFSYYSDSSTIACNELMPYAKNSKFKIVNRSLKDIDATLSIKTIPISWDNKLPYYSAKDK